MLLLIAATPARALADDDSTPASFHKGQFGLSARLALGVRGIATYDNKYYCGQLDSSAKYGNAPVCTGVSPFSLQLEPSFGVSRTIELLAELRIGIGRDFGGSAAASGPRQLWLAPGARFFFSEATHSKLFVQTQLVFDFTGYQDPTGASRGNDFGVRGLEGYWIDVHRAYGFYFYVGETAEFSRWLYAELEAGVGFQGRYP